MSESQPTWIGKTLGGRYLIESMLGRGGMSSVYKARDPNLQRTVAIKIIHPHLTDNDEFVRRFEQEAAAVAKLRHPNIMQVHDFNHEGQAYYIVFEYIPGEPLDKRLQTLKEADLRLPLDESLTIIATLSNAVAYAHERNMVHRDLKPSNVILNLLGQPILLDFGIAKIIGSASVQTATGATIGTAAYMPPEQVIGDPVDHRADIYSLGIMLYEMTAGRPPYEGTSPMTVMMKHVNEPLPDIRQINRNLPDNLTPIINKALAKNPDDRFSSAVEFEMALRDLKQQLQIGQTIPTTAMVTDTSPKPALTTAVTPPSPPTQPEPVVTQTETAVSSTPETTPKKRKPLIWIAGLVGVIALLALIGLFISRSNTPTETSIPPSAGMVQIPAGSYQVGNGAGGGQYAAAQSIDLPSYWIDRFETTNAEYADFLAETGATVPSSWNGNSYPPGEDDFPVSGVDWATAVTYCGSLGKRLPTEAEWEVAARGSENLLYPWGDEQNEVTLPTNSTYAIGDITANRSSFGLFDMAGNVWEWVAEPYTAVNDDEKIARGGAYDFQKDMAYRLQGDPTVPTMYAKAGIRCAATTVDVVPDAAILIEDDFTDEASGWPVKEEVSALSGYHPPDYYHVQSGVPDHITTAYFGGSFNNVSVDADVFIDSTDTEDGLFRYGLVVRRDGDEFYAFTISPRTNEWTVLKGTGNGLEILDEGSSMTMSGFTEEESDQLRIDASGPELVFSINGRVVSQLNDASYGSGDVGFYVETFDESRAHIHYDLLKVEQIP